MANFYYNQNDSSWYSDDQYTTAADISTITSGDALIGDISNVNFGIVGVTSLVGVDFSQVTTMANTYLEGLDLTNVDLSNVQFAGLVSIYLSTISGLILPSDISNLNLGYVDASGVDFSNVTTVNHLGLSSGSWYNVNFGGWNPSGVSFSNVLLGGTISNLVFPSSLLGFAFFNLPDLSLCDFSNVTDLADAQFGSTNFSGADFSNVVSGTLGADLSSANLADVTYPLKAYFNGAYYIGGAQTTLDADGNGFWSGKAYYYGSEQPTGWNNYFYYINNAETTLDTSGSGEWNGGTYVDGVLQGGGVKNGWINSIYWINDVATTLDQNGNGTWVGKLYENGSLFSGSKYGLTFVAGVAQAEQIMANFYYNQNDSSWYSDDQYTTAADISTITSGDALIGDISNVNFGIVGVTSLVGVDFSQVTTMANTYLEGLDLTNVDLSNVQFAGLVSIYLSTISGLILPSDISNLNLGYVDASGVDFSNVTTVNHLGLSSGSWYNVNFGGWNPSGVSFSNVLLGGTISNLVFPSSLLGFAFFNLPDLSLCDFSNVTDLADAQFGSTNFSGADFSNVVSGTLGADLSSANLADVTYPLKAYFNGAYYIGGAQTTLDADGNGFWSGKAYYYGSEQPTGWNNYFYYINNAETTLDTSGSGEWNGGTYVDGVLQGGGNSSAVVIQGNAKFYGNVKFGI